MFYIVYMDLWCVSYAMLYVTHAFPQKLLSHFFQFTLNLSILVDDDAVSHTRILGIFTLKKNKAFSKYIYSEVTIIRILPCLSVTEFKTSRFSTFYSMELTMDPASQFWSHL